MRFTLVTALLTLVWGPAGASLGNHPNIPKDDSHIQGVPRPSGRVDGDTIEEAWVIPALPFSGSGNTCEFIDHYEESCPYTGSLSPDVVYAYTATEDLYIDIDLCYSLYDTKVFVYENEWTPWDPYACNDDYHTEEPCFVYSSAIYMLPIYAGSTYYIVVDGYGSDCGSYALDVVSHAVHTLECPDEAILEGEPECADEYVDEYNGGCGAIPPVFQGIAPGTGESIYFCGESGTYFNLGSPYRDTDWLELVIDAESDITCCAIAEFELQFILIDGTLGCEDLNVIEMATSAPYEDVCLTHQLNPGTYWLWVGPVTFDGWPCPWTYLVTIDGYVENTTPPTQVTWGALKSRFR